ncbi:hypothetical protein NQZ68_023038 [Dissostichus eleginoides]|nr:hypothetical protein NQZ68_023038 [Dissostichus eleginoides]
MTFGQGEEVLPGSCHHCRELWEKEEGMCKVVSALNLPSNAPSSEKKQIYANDQIPKAGKYHSSKP